MVKIAINILGWNHDIKLITECLDKILAQDYQDYEVWYSENGSTISLLPELKEKYGSNLKVKLVNNGANLGFALGHNKFLKEADAEFLMPINPDAHMAMGFLSNLLKAFDDPKVGMATGKMLKPEKNEDGNPILDGTGVVIYKSRRGRERGQMEEDYGQYDKQSDVFGVSGTAPLYRKAALLDAEIKGEIYDPDFFAYWEDVDLSWRLRLMGWKAKYIPEAIIYHSRVAGSHKGGYGDLLGFIKHHGALKLSIRRWSWRNHLFCIVKNDFAGTFWKNFPRIITRELAMLIYICLFEPRTLGAVPSFFELLPKMLEKRKIIQSKRKISSSEMEKLFI